jgi:hypothetical protein
MLQEDSVAFYGNYIFLSPKAGLKTEVNDLGSGDITTLISDIGTRLQSDREANNRQAGTITYLLLLSRLKILQHCLTISGSQQTFTSAR